MWNSKSSVAVACLLPRRAKDIPAPLYNLMGPPSYMRSVDDRNVVMLRVTVFMLAHIFKGYAAHCFSVIFPFSLPMAQEHDPRSAKPNVWPLSLHKNFSPCFMIPCISCHLIIHSTPMSQRPQITPFRSVPNKRIPCALSVWTRRPEREAGPSPPPSAEIKNKYSNTSTAFIETFYTSLTRLNVRNSEFFTNVTLYSWLFWNWKIQTSSDMTSIPFHRTRQQFGQGRAHNLGSLSTRIRKVG